MSIEILNICNYYTVTDDISCLVYCIEPIEPIITDILLLNMNIGNLLNEQNESSLNMFPPCCVTIGNYINGQC